MRINGVQSCNVYQNNNLDCKKKQHPAFKANISDSLWNMVKNEAKARNLLTELFGMRTKIANWGDKNSIVNAFENFDRPGTFCLGLDNHKISKLYGGSMGEHEAPSLLDVILNLKQKNILQGEQDLKNIIAERKSVVLAKALDSDDVYNQVKTAVPHSNGLYEAVENLPEEKLVDLYFDNYKNVDHNSPKFKEIMSKLIGFVERKMVSDNIKINSREINKLSGNLLN